MGLRIAQITEKDKHELGELGYRAVKAVHAFLECLDEVSDGQISEEMKQQYGTRQGVRGTGPYGRGNYRDEADYRDDPGYGRRDDPGYGRRDDPGYGRRDGAGYRNYNMRDY